ncbi:MAG TPA: exodeoxyribonuclease VII large subunit [Burkholderiaceae bacterium]|nr:exodeoxyribonuclease VII large subunit [Burkholderiaceae bacterium]
MYEPSEAVARRPWSVAALLLAANDALQARFGACAVRGELSGFTRAGSGHCYFTLKDADGSPATLRCAMFRRSASLLDFSPRDGQQVELRGRIAVYESRGELQFVAEAMLRVGAGTLYEEFLRRKARLEAQGLLDASRKRSLPAFPTRIGVITSLDAAALHDVATTMQRRAPHVEVIVYPSVVQGADAPVALVAALSRAARRAEVELVLLCRGGGSLEDLWAFNDEHVVRAIAASPIPVVCGIGHETDVTLADLAADVRAPTPTAAAELAAPSQSELLGQLRGWAVRAHRAAQRQLEGRELRLDQISLRLARPAQLLGGHLQRLGRHDERRRNALVLALQLQGRRQDEVAARMLRAARAHVQRCAARLDTLQARLHALDPRQVLSRGYAWIMNEQGRAVVSAKELQPGDLLRAVWADGYAHARVLDVNLEAPEG